MKMTSEIPRAFGIEIVAADPLRPIESALGFLALKHLFLVLSATQ